MTLPLETAGLEARPTNERRRASRGAPSDATIGSPREAADLSVPEAERRLAHAVSRLERADPDATAARRLVRWQAWALTVVALAVACGLWLAPAVTIAALMATGTLPSLAILALRLTALGDLIGSGDVVPPRPVPPARSNSLPTYSILVPLYREAKVLPQLVAALDALDYPRDRLEIFLIVERHDVTTMAAVAALERPLPKHMLLIEVPSGAPRTKPRALDYALTFARGEFVTVYDAEDQPERDQLRQAVTAFRAGGDGLGCLQARLNVYEPERSWLRRQFAIEYTALFDAMLPTLAHRRLPVMLGGTSNHFPRKVLEAVGAWDPYNVTEDADLGLRLARHGYRVDVLPSTTWEEAPRAPGVWLGQRTRWLKGWMQTWLVHMRRPRRLLAEVGWRGLLAVNLLHGGAVLTALAHPWICLLLALDWANGVPFAGDGGGLGPLVWWLAISNLGISYLAAIMLGLATVQKRGRGWLSRSAAWLPLYWLAISVAAHRAVLELLTAPHHWEKTAHEGRAVSRPSDGTAGQQESAA